MGGALGTHWFCRGIGIFGGHVADPDRAGRNSDWIRTDRDRCIDGTLEEARGNTGETEAAPTAEHRDIRRQGWGRRRESWPHTDHGLDQSPHRWVVASRFEFERVKSRTFLTFHTVATLLNKGEFERKKTTRSLSSLFFLFFLFLFIFFFYFTFNSIVEK